MNNNDIKITLLNTSVFALSFADIENFLKIILLLISIVYTGYKTLELHKKHTSSKQNEDESSRVSK